MTAGTPLSRRGSKLSDTSPMPEYIQAHFDRVDQEYSSASERYVGLAVAENKLVWDLLEPVINDPRDVPARAAGYDDMVGSEAFRTTLASFASEHIWGREVDASQVIALAGAGAVLELLFHVLGDPGDGVLVPTPSYAGFWMDIESRDGMVVVPVHSRAETGFTLSVADLQAAYDGADVPVRVLLLTNPVNPTGRILSTDEIRNAVAWARSVGVHIVINEIYALSTHGDTPFVPTGSVIDDVGDDMHFVWAFSKDFAMSGFRCGVMTSQNEDVRAAVSALAYWACVSGDTQHLLDTMLQDTEWLAGYLTGMRSRLRESYTRTTAALSAAGIPYIPADAALFLLCDFRQYLSEPTWDAEDALWRRILDEANVNLTPGSACHIAEPGFLRLCFAQEPPDVVEAAIARIARTLR
ncbi:MAG: aminotransferase class I/II-fold pyridoxal phosphate-dependent enzyme [Actinobacteria bacterium]|nr:aminotransferase class I/II-fold pyridoxal phosphate-dependent enzyme [Actinomycetota bacterium]